MAYVTNGDPLTDYVAIPGWSVNVDAWGLCTASVTFKVNSTVDKVNPLVIGQALDDAAFTFMKAHKSSSKYDGMNIATVTIDYVGIWGGETETIPQLFSASSLSSDNITTHENFFNAAADYSEVISGVAFSADTMPGIGPVVKKLNAAGTPVPVPCHLTNNGAAFETETGGRFIGFVDPNFPAFYGKTNYLTPTANFTGIVYTTDAELVGEFVNKMGWSSATPDWAGNLPQLVPDYMGSDFVGNLGSQLLLSQASVEVFAGAIYKVSFEVKFSREGWHPAVYKDVSPGA
jgi:hypothetical protein